MGWWSPVAAASCRLDALRVSRSLRRSCRDFEVRVDTAFDEVVAACADPRRPGAGSTAGSSRPTCGSTPSAGPTRSRPGATAGSWAGCTASRSGGCSRRVDVPPRARRLEGRAGRARGAAPRRPRRRPADRRPVGHATWRASGCGGGPPSDVPPKTGARALGTPLLARIRGRSGAGPASQGWGSGVPDRSREGRGRATRGDPVELDEARTAHRNARAGRSARPRAAAAAALPVHATEEPALRARSTACSRTSTSSAQPSEKEAVAAIEGPGQGASRRSGHRRRSPTRPRDGAST